MHSDIRTARTVGLLFLISYAAFIAGSALLGAALDPSTDLGAIFPSSTQVTAGVLLQFTNDAAIIGIAVLLFPILRRHGEGLALGYVGLRIIEAAAYAVARISTLSLVTVSEKYAAAGAADAPYYQALRMGALADITAAGLLATVAFILGAVVLYSLLYRSRLVPRWLSVWGLGAVAALTVANVVVPSSAKDFQPAMLLFIPIILNELLLAIRLVARGFDADAVSAPGRTAVGPAATSSVITA
jgi:hypothetical protein